MEIGDRIKSRREELGKIKVFVMLIATRQHSTIQFLPLFCPSEVIKIIKKYAKRY